MIRLDASSMDVFVNGITLATEEDLDACIGGVEELLGLLKHAKKNGVQVYADHRERQRDGKDPWHFIRYRLSDRPWRTAVAPQAKKAGSWK
jgi:hypothetical protein